MKTTFIVARWERQAKKIAELRGLPAGSWVWTPTESAADHIIARSRERGVKGRFERIRVGGWGLDREEEQ